MNEAIAGEFDSSRALKRKSAVGWLQRCLDVDHLLFHPLALGLARWVYPTRITPNQLTGLSFLLGVAVALLFAVGSRPAVTAAGVLALLTAIVDNADGMLARARNQCSEFGAYLDLMLDRVTDVVMIAAIGVGAARTFGRPWLLTVGLAAAALYGLQIIVFYLTKSFLKNPSRGETGSFRDFASFLFFVFALLHRMDIALLLVALQAVLTVTIRVFYFLSLKNRRPLA